MRFVLAKGVSDNQNPSTRHKHPGDRGTSYLVNTVELNPVVITAVASPFKERRGTKWVPCGLMPEF